MTLNAYTKDNTPGFFYYSSEGNEEHVEYFDFPGPGKFYKGFSESQKEIIYCDNDMKISYLSNYVINIETPLYTLSSQECYYCNYCYKKVDNVFSLGYNKVGKLVYYNANNNIILYYNKNPIYTEESSGRYKYYKKNKIIHDITKKNRYYLKDSYTYYDNNEHLVMRSKSIGFTNEYIDIVGFYYRNDVKIGTLINSLLYNNNKKICGGMMNGKIYINENENLNYNDISFYINNVAYNIQMKVLGDVDPKDKSKIGVWNIYDDECNNMGCEMYTQE